MGYETSGWCFAEASTAWLGKQSTPFSSNTATLNWFQNWDCDIHDSEGLINKLDKELRSKHFFNESDRKSVQFILRGFVVKRRLVEAIAAKSVPKLEAALAEITNHWTAFLDQPVDWRLNTPLHLAVAYDFSEGVMLLLEHRADPKLRNLRGDAPVQFLACPRLGRAAWTCRRAEPSERVDEEYQQQEGIRFSWGSGGQATSRETSYRHRRNLYRVQLVGRELVWLPTGTVRYEMLGRYYHGWPGCHLPGFVYDCNEELGGSFPNQRILLGVRKLRQ